ncbi:MAG: hypothetical protein QM831_05860 [Kofleriaceae bacterium]
MRCAVVSLFVAASCGRSSGVPDKDLNGLVEGGSAKPRAIDVDRAAKDVDELSAALAQPARVVNAALGPHTTTISMATHVVDGAQKPVTDLDDKTAIEIGDKGTFHAVYTNSADYGREVTFVDGKLYLRPRYQRWHERGPETPDEPLQIVDSFYDPIEATWDLVAPGAELADRGAATVAGRPGRKIEIKPAPSPRKNPPEPLTQRKWREGRSIDGLTGEVVLDAQKGVPLSVRLSGTIGFTREGKKYSMQVSVQSDVTMGPAQVAMASTEEIVTTPERLREVDDRDFLLNGIAPPLRKNTDGTAVAPQPKAAGSGSKK